MARVPGLRARLEARAPESEELPALCALVRESGALDAALAEAHRRVDEALLGLQVLPPGPYRDGLAVLGRHLVERCT